MLHNFQVTLYMTNYRKITDLKQRLKGAKVGIRIDANVPMANGKIADNSRLLEILPSINFLLEEGAGQIFIFSHFGRPNGHEDPACSLKQIKESLERLLKEKLGFSKPHDKNLSTSRLTLCENLRYYPGEEKGDESFAKMLLEGLDFYINDAFSASHRAHASISVVGEQAPIYAGFLMQKEIENLQAIVSRETGLSLAIIGGSKISTKINLLFNLINKINYIFIGGGMANTFLSAKGFEVGRSLTEPGFKKVAIEILEAAKIAKCEIILPHDVIVSKEIIANAPCRVSDVSKIMKDEIIVDTGNKTLIQLNSILQKCGLFLWNGPLGICEITPFNTASFSFARDVSEKTEQGLLKSVIGGGDTGALIQAAGLKNQMSYISTAGGAFLEWLEGKELPGIRATKC